eukprot:SAG11_NODE_15116_length_588_cov_1.498978_1_plen_43_part_10
MYGGICHVWADTTLYQRVGAWLNFDLSFVFFLAADFFLASAFL